MNIVVPFGFYGWGNIGDEATLNGFARVLAFSGLRAKVSVGSRNPTHTKQIEPAFRYFSVARKDPRRWWAKFRASAHAFAGGTPIMDVLGEWPLSDVAPLVRSIDRWRVPLVFVGVGIESLRMEESHRIVAEEIAPRVRHWSVRCDRDRQRLEDYGVPPGAITVAADMAWLIEPATDEFGRDRLLRWGVDLRFPVIAVNLVNENAIFENQPELADAIAAALDHLLAHLNGQVIFVANEVREGPGFDKAAAILIMAKMKRADRARLAPSDYLAPREMMSIIDCCALTISMRYHFCLFSALQGVPFIAVERSDKVSDLCWDLDWPCRIVPPGFSAPEIIDHATRLLQAPSVAEELLSRQAQKMKERALRNVVPLETLNKTSNQTRPWQLTIPGGKHG